MVEDIFKKRDIKNLKCYYNFFTDGDFRLRSTIFSDCSFSCLIDFKDVEESRESFSVKKEEDCVEEEVLDLEKLRKKRQKINNFLKNIYPNDYIQQLDQRAQTQADAPFCKFCNKRFAKQGLWLKKHQEKCQKNNI